MILGFETLATAYAKAGRRARRAARAPQLQAQPPPPALLGGLACSNGREQTDVDGTRFPARR